MWNNTQYTIANIRTKIKLCGCHIAVTLVLGRLTGLLQVQGWPELQSKTLSQRKILSQRKTKENRPPHIHRNTITLTA